MQIQRATAHLPSVGPTASPARSRSGMAAPVDAAAAPRTATASDTGTQTADFRHMTRKGLADWMNAQIKSGQMSLDDSSGLLGMTMAVPVDAPSGPLTFDDHARVDFMALAQDGMDWARQHGDQSQVQMLQKAIDTMARHQGQTTRVDVHA